MKALILCEGTTDLILLQLLLQYRYDYRYHGYEEEKCTNRLVQRIVKKQDDFVEIHSCGGINNIPYELAKVKDKMVYATQADEIYDRVIVMIDHDTISSNGEFLNQINAEIGTSWSESDLSQWLEWEITNTFDESMKLQFYCESVPSEGTGRIENVMLAALNTDGIEDEIIIKCTSQIQEIKDMQERYIKNESAKYKAIFNTYFAIRTPEEKYDERAKILKAYNWKDNSVLQEQFGFLDVLN